MTAEGAINADARFVALVVDGRVQARLQEAPRQLAHLVVIS